MGLAISLATLLLGITMAGSGLGAVGLPAAEAGLVLMLVGIVGTLFSLVVRTGVIADDSGTYRTSSHA